MSEQDSICSICGLEPEDILILQCKHNLCIDCATEVYAINNKKNTFTCQICLTQTILDSQTIKELKGTASPHKIPDAEKPPKPSQNKRNYDSIDTCQQHHQSLMYYCFDCESFKICPECILTPKHQSHQVCTIKKAIKTIAKKIGEHSKKKQSFRQKLQMRKANVLHRKEMVLSDITQKKATLKSTFDDIVKNVSEKYNSLTAQLEQVSRRNIQILEGCITAIEDKIEDLNKTIEIQRSIVSHKSEKQILGYYGEMRMEDDVMEIQEPTEFFDLKLALLNSETVTITIHESLNQLEWYNNEKDHEQQNRHRISQEFSIIDRQDNFRLRESGKTMTNMSQSYSGHSNAKKLELSRSISNATNIINKLQSRLKNT